MGRTTPCTWASTEAHVFHTLSRQQHPQTASTSHSFTFLPLSLLLLLILPPSLSPSAPSHFSVSPPRPPTSDSPPVFSFSSAAVPGAHRTAGWRAGCGPRVFCLRWRWDGPRLRVRTTTPGNPPRSRHSASLCALLAPLCVHLFCCLCTCGAALSDTHVCLH